MSDAASAIEAVFQREHGRVLASLISYFEGDFDLAEDALQDACLAALTRWAREGVPQNPAAWLTAIARRRAIDRARKGGARGRQRVLLDEYHPAPVPDDDAMNDNDDAMSFPDERLKLIFTCCHPALKAEAQVVLTLRTLGGLTTEAIARAFIMPVPTMAQRIARAKDKIRSAGIPYRVPALENLAERLDAVLRVIYLIFNEGYSAHGGDQHTRAALCEEAIRLCRALVALLPGGSASAEARGLLSLMLLTHARREGRLSADHRLALLEDQDRRLWDQAMIAEGRQLIEETLRLGAVGAYQVQAAIAALHDEARSYADTDWAQIAALYGLLAHITESPVVEVNRAVAIAMTDGVGEGLRHILCFEDVLDDYFPFHAARADLLRRAGEREAAAEAYERAIALCSSSSEAEYLQSRLTEMLG